MFHVERDIRPGKARSFLQRQRKSKVLRERVGGFLARRLVSRRSFGTS
jgi:antibiotic biosynthesis monooxygenase (ABM) superfamily enzyme